ncbi:MAG: MoxR family ATPase [Halieaceae bacterium]
MNFQLLAQLETWLGQQIVGQQDLIHKLMLSLLADGHLLVEGAPGLAKTRAIKEMAEGIEGSFHRIQFTPDLLPGDITGTDIFRPQTGAFEFQQGPIFNNLVLADEINRAPAKVQSALLEAMAERQVSIGSQTYELPRLFLVMATQNPIEQEGTYPLPEAQLDRFLMHVRVSYPDADAEQQILRLARNEASGERVRPAATVSQADLFAARQAVLSIHMAAAVEEYIVQLIVGTREAGRYDSELAEWLEFGASPRATIALDRCARANAWIAGRDYVSPDDVQAVAHDCLRHRLIVSFEAEAAGISSDQIIERLIERIPVA